MSTIFTVPENYPDEIIGYVEPWITSPGTVIAVKISSTEPNYTYRLIRLIQGHEGPHAPDIVEEVISEVPSGTGVGRFQLARSGSYGVVQDIGLKSSDDGIQVSLYVQPTMTDAGHSQCIFSTLDYEHHSGIELTLEDHGNVSLRVGVGDAIEFLSTGQTLVQGEWVKTVVSVQQKTASITCSPIRRYATEPTTAKAFGVTLKSAISLRANSRLLLAASQASNDSLSRLHRKDFFNGRLEAIEIKALGPDERQLLILDFLKKIPTDEINDISGNERHGQLYNAPTRAVRGHDWDGVEVDWTKATYGYGAIHFHDDDLDDAEWQTDFELLIPSSARSGAYAVEVRSTRDPTIYDKVTFFVRPSDISTAKIALVCSTFTYQAYANERMFDKEKPSRLPDPNPNFEILEDEHYHKMVRRTDLGLSLYDVHRDLSGTVFSSIKRPILNLRPGFQHWAFKRPREFSADLIMIGFLERLGVPYDVVFDHDLHTDGYSSVSRYNTLISGSHPEYPSLSSLNVWTKFAQEGGNIMYLGGNGFYWMSVPDPLNPHRLEVRRADQGVRTFELHGGERHHSINGTQGGLWRSRGRAANYLFGIGCCGEGLGPGVPYKRSAAAQDPQWSWIFEDVSKDELLGVNGFGGPASGDEIDRFDLELGSPHNTVILATSTGHSDDFGLMPEEVGFPLINTLGTQTDKVRSDMTIYRTSGGGHVFSVGSMNWYNALGWDGYENNIATITANLIKRFSKSS